VTAKALESDMAEILAQPAVGSTELDHVVQVRGCPLSFGLAGHRFQLLRRSGLRLSGGWMLGYDCQSAGDRSKPESPRFSMFEILNATV